MSIIIYEKNPDGLIATGDRNVSTFPSGLCRVDQTFVCRSSMAASHRLNLSVGSNFPNGNMPAVDGLKIYPEVQETKRSDGFTEFKVSAYGRTSLSFDNYTMKAEKQRLWNFGITQVDGLYVAGTSYQIDATYYKVDGKFVILKGQDLSVDELNLPSQLFGLKGILRLLKRREIQTSPLSNIAETSYDYIDWNGTPRVNKYITYKYYTGPGGSGQEIDQLNSVVSRIVYDFPVIKINNETNFGSFTELEISVMGRALDSVFSLDDE